MESLFIKEHDLKKRIELFQRETHLISQIELLLDLLLTYCEEDRGFGSAAPEQCLNILKTFKGSIHCCIDRSTRELKMKQDGILLYLHCAQCAKTKPKNQSMEHYARLNVGRTEEGIQIWCTRHNKSVAHLPYDWSSIDKLNHIEQMQKGDENCTSTTT
ncbi:MAG: hypothetical protein PHS86_01995 [Syntrophaceae bacterium]|nr:hypothetical protein [Syntrophaceae bacterium]